MQYWIVINGVQQGPYTLEQLAALPYLTPDTPVWHEGLTGWTTLRQLPGLMARISQPQYSQPQYTAPQYQQPHYQATHTSPYQNPDTPAVPPPNYLVWAILTTICCCLPFGVVAIVYSSKVNSLFALGDYAGAASASEKAMWWTIIAFVVGLIAQPFAALFQLAAL